MSTRSYTWWALAVLPLLALPVVGGAADQGPPPAKAAPVSPAPAAIPLAEVATRAAEVSNLLPTFTAQLATSPEMQTVLARLPEVTERIGAELGGLAEILRANPPLATIAAQQQLWQGRHRLASEWLTQLTRRATQLQDGLSRLAALQETWRQTRVSAQAANAPATTLQQIDAVLADLAQTELPFRTQQTAVLGLQSRVAQEVARCGSALELLAQADRTAMGGDAGAGCPADLERRAVGAGSRYPAQPHPQRH